MVKPTPAIAGCIVNASSATVCVGDAGCIAGSDGRSGVHATKTSTK